jgi:hypothetical protein
MCAGVTCWPSRTAGSNSADRNGSTRDPSVLVPSGNSTTGIPSRNASSIECRTRGVSLRCRRSTKIVPPSRASHPNNGHDRTSNFDTKMHGNAALNIRISR